MMLPSERDLIADLEARVRLLEQLVRELQRRLGPTQ